MELHLLFWHWWAIGAGLLIVELLAPGMFFLWMAIGAAVTGTLMLALPTLAWEFQITVFSVVSVVCVFAAQRFVRKHPIETDQPLLNQRSARYVGRSFTLSEPITNGRGRLRVDDSYWPVEGEDCPAGYTVKVIGTDGVLLKVARDTPQTET